MEDKLHLPKVWLVVLGIVGAGIIVHIALWILGISGLLIWPFLWAACVMLIISDAADATGGGVAPVVAYASFFGTLLVAFIFVLLVSKTINPYVLLLMVVAAGVYLAKDWKKRWEREREIQRRREAHLCLRCMQPVTDGIEDICENCGLPVNPERMNLFRLGKAIQNRSQQTHTRQILTSTKPAKADARFQAKAATYKKRK